MQGERHGMLFAGGLRDGEKKKWVRGKGWKSYCTCTLMGKQIPSKLAASRQEFDAALDASQPGEAAQGDEKTDKGVRGERIQIDRERWGEWENKEEDVSRLHHVLFLPHCVPNTIFSLSNFPPLWLIVFASTPSYSSPLAVLCVRSASSVVPRARLLHYRTVRYRTVAACDV